MFFDPVLVITRPKKNGIGTHWGVQFPDGRVYDYVHGVDLRVTDIDGFADGSDVTVVREISWSLGLVVQGRLDELMANPRKYDLLNWNCETFAEWLTSGVAKSGQVIGGLILAGIVALLIAAR